MLSAVPNTVSALIQLDPPPGCSKAPRTQFCLVKVNAALGEVRRLSPKVEFISSLKFQVTSCGRGSNAVLRVNSLDF